MATADRTWFPPTALKGKHWRLELLRVDGTWGWYTEHLTPYHAERMLRLKCELYPKESWRVVEAFR
jgi:hypothetical protein